MTPTFSSPNLRQLFDLSRRGNIQAGGACTTWRWWVNLSRSRILTCYRRYYLLPLNKLKSTETGMVHGPRIQIESSARMDVASELDPHFAKTFAYALHDLYHSVSLYHVSHFVGLHNSNLCLLWYCMCTEDTEVHKIKQDFPGRSQEVQNDSLCFQQESGLSQWSWCHSCSKVRTVGRVLWFHV